MSNEFYVGWTIGLTIFVVFFCIIFLRLLMRISMGIERTHQSLELIDRNLKNLVHQSCLNEIDIKLALPVIVEKLHSLSQATWKITNEINRLCEIKKEKECNKEKKMKRTLSLSDEEVLNIRKWAIEKAFVVLRELDSEQKLFPSASRLEKFVIEGYEEEENE